MYMKVKKKIILQIGKNLCSLALVLIMMICILPQMTVKADNVGTTEEKLEEDPHKGKRWQEVFCTYLKQYRCCSAAYADRISGE